MTHSGSLRRCGLLMCTMGRLLLRPYARPKTSSGLKYVRRKGRGGAKKSRTPREGIEPPATHPLDAHCLSGLRELRPYNQELNSKAVLFGRVSGRPRKNELQFFSVSINVIVPHFEVQRRDNRGSKEARPRV
ncbi:hypothetical protein BOTBODRAFT_55696 [Botryobasidium botryosum FD-172 SS1]|uniref:Uncharacterized protein n=1 Tax=Botryobasidium botryosum (strain FD-172 SS1) TaxID=930990 RepID=A0A067MEJ3_BOTB1|nr:hypothetical protein BOTBODRAFT_55696 [Botryobasidium botryosum FD-172 SS1]